MRRSRGARRRGSDSWLWLGSMETTQNHPLLPLSHQGPSQVTKAQVSSVKHLPGWLSCSQWPICQFKFGRLNSLDCSLEQAIDDFFNGKLLKNDADFGTPSRMAGPSSIASGKTQPTTQSSPALNPFPHPAPQPSRPWDHQPALLGVSRAREQHSVDLVLHACTPSGGSDQRALQAPSTLQS